VACFIAHTVACFADQRIVVSECWSDKLAANSLVKPLLVIMAHVLVDHVSKMLLAEEAEVPQALEFDRSDEPLRVGIAVRAPGRNLDACNTLAISKIGWLEDRLERVREERVGIMNQIPCITKKSRRQGR
jgi:hypothetical protein